MSRIDPIEITTFGAGGVDVDSDPLRSQDDTLVRAENMEHDPTQGHQGAMRKRPGLQTFTPIGFGAPVWGGVTMPIASSDSGGNDGGGTTSGGGDDSGAPPPPPPPPPAEISLSPVIGDPGTVVAVTGSGFGPSEVVNLFFNGVDLTTPVTTEADGTFTSWPFDAPSITPGGNYVVQAVGSVSGQVATAVYTLTLPPQPFGGDLFGFDKIVVYGMGNNSPISNSGGARGWRVAPADFSADAVEFTAPGPPMRVYSYPPTTRIEHNGVAGVFNPNENFVYYQLAKDQVSGPSNTVTIRKTDGRTDVFVADLAANTNIDAQVNNPSNTNIRASLVDMVVGDDGNLYLAVKDKAAGQDTQSNVGRVFRLDPATGVATLVQDIGTNRPSGIPALAGCMPVSVCFYRGQVFSGGAVLVGSEFANGGVDDSTKATSYILRTNESETSANLEIVLDGGSSVGATAMIKFPFADHDDDACMFVGLAFNDTIHSATYASVFARIRDEESAPGVPQWVGVTPDTSLFSTSAQTHNFWSGFAELGGNLYAAHWNAGIINIFKYVPSFSGSVAGDGKWLPTGGSDTDGGTWTRVYTSASGSPAVRLTVANNKLYALGGPTAVGQMLMLESSNGTSWTARTSRMTVGSNQPRFGMPVIYVPPA